MPLAVPVAFVSGDAGPPHAVPRITPQMSTSRRLMTATNVPAAEKFCNGYPVATSAISRQVLRHALHTDASTDDTSERSAAGRLPQKLHFPLPFFATVKPAFAALVASARSARAMQPSQM